MWGCLSPVVRAARNGGLHWIRESEEYQVNLRRIVCCYRQIVRVLVQSGSYSGEGEIWKGGVRWCQCGSCGEVFVQTNLDSGAKRSVQKKRYQLHSRAAIIMASWSPIRSGFNVETMSWLNVD